VTIFLLGHNRHCTYLGAYLDTIKVSRC